MHTTTTFLLLAVTLQAASEVIRGDKDLFRHYSDSLPAVSADIARYVNSLGTTWKATEQAPGMLGSMTLGEARRLLGVKRRFVVPRKAHTPSSDAFPESFDARTNWPNCPTLRVIRDQSGCGSCWAFGAAEAMSDRYCIAFGADDETARNLSISTRDLVACCSDCGDGCMGGYPEAAWEQWTTTGLVTETCEPYPFPFCAHHMKPKDYPACKHWDTPPCLRACANGQPITNATRYKGKTVTYFSGEDDFKKELMTNGPIELVFTVYVDFLTYSSGIYHHVTGDEKGGHAVKLLGWGVDNGTPYWTIANSWNDEWGENGTFRILRGSDECGIEDSGVAGLPAKP